MSFTKRLVDWTTASGHIKHTTPGDERGDSGYTRTGRQR